MFVNSYTTIGLGILRKLSRLAIGMTLEVNHSFAAKTITASQKKIILFPTSKGTMQNDPILNASDQKPIPSGHALQHISKSDLRTGFQSMD